MVTVFELQRMTARNGIRRLISSFGNHYLYSCEEYVVMKLFTMASKMRIYFYKPSFDFEWSFDQHWKVKHLGHTFHSTLCLGSLDGPILLQFFPDNIYIKWVNYGLHAWLLNLF
jgi:hypothetical protein